MTSLLRRSQAPLTDRAWEEVDVRARQVLKSQLSARQFVDVDGPHGWGCAAVDTGRLQVAEHESGAVPWGVRKVLPLLELRMPFVLLQIELDAISRGCRDPKLGPLEEAVNKAARFEESVIYRGLQAAHVRGMLPATLQESVTLPKDPLQYPAAVAQALEALSADGLPGPYVLVLGREPYFRLLQRGEGNYPPRRVIEKMADLTILPTAALHGGVVLSAAPGSFQLTIGQDWSVGYASHDRDEVELYITESFTFRVLEPAAVVELTVE